MGKMLVGSDILIGTWLGLFVSAYGGAYVAYTILTPNGGSLAGFVAALTIGFVTMLGGRVLLLGEPALPMWPPATIFWLRMRTLCFATGIRTYFARFGVHLLLHYSERF